MSLLFLQGPGLALADRDLSEQTLRKAQPGQPSTQTTKGGITEQHPLHCLAPTPGPSTKTCSLGGHKAFALLSPVFPH